MTLPHGLYDRLVYEDEVGKLAALADQRRALIEAPTSHQRREQFIAELVHRLPARRIEAGKSPSIPQGERA